MHAYLIVLKSIQLQSLNNYYIHLYQYVDINMYTLNNKLIENVSSIL